MFKLITAVIFSLLITTIAQAEPALQLKPNSTYVKLYDVDLTKLGVHTGEGFVDYGIPFYTTDPLDSYEGRGTLHLSTKGIFFEGKLICDLKESRLINCPADLPLIVEPQKDNKLSIFIQAERFEKVKPEGKKVIFHFRDEELMLNYFEKDFYGKPALYGWKVIRTDSKGAIVPEKAAKPQ